MRFQNLLTVVNSAVAERRDAKQTNKGLPVNQALGAIMQQLVALFLRLLAMAWQGHGRMSRTTVLLSNNRHGGSYCIRS